jgi:hypothetical protein
VGFVNESSETKDWALFTCAEGFSVVVEEGNMADYLGGGRQQQAGATHPFINCIYPYILAVYYEMVGAFCATLVPPLVPL